MAWSNNIEEAYDLIRPLFKEKSFIIYDTETTGLNKTSDRVLQFSAVKVSVPEFNIIDTIDIFIKCPFSVPSFITQINRIDDDLLEREGLDEDEAFKLIKDFIGDNAVLSGYNIDKFDNLFMERMYNENGEKLNIKASVDIMTIAKKVIAPDDVYDPEKKRPSFTQSNCVKYYGSEGEFAYHSAIEDVNASKYLLEHLICDIENKMELKTIEASTADNSDKRKAFFKELVYFRPSKIVDRVYVTTNQGIFYYDNYKRVWSAKPGQGNTDAVDMKELREKILKFIGATDDDSMYKIVRKQNKICAYMWLPYIEDGKIKHALVSPFWVKKYYENNNTELPENWNEDMNWYGICSKMLKLMDESLKTSINISDAAKADDAIRKIKES